MRSVCHHDHTPANHRLHSLAAVDMHTAQHLVRNALSGKLASGRTIILVTHHLSLCLPVAGYLLDISAGRIVRQGTIEDLQNKGQLQKLVEAEESPVEEKKFEASIPPSNEADRLDLEEPVKRQKHNGKLVEAETRQEGRISLRSYLTYIRAAGIICWILTLLLLIQIRLINIGVQVRNILPPCGLSAF